VLVKPSARKSGNFLESAALFKEVGSAGNDLNVVQGADFSRRAAIQLNDNPIELSDNQERWCSYSRQHGPGQIRPATS
jgi:hypothetical protein